MMNDRPNPRLELGLRRLAFLSVRATGFDPNVNRIVEVAVVMRKESVAEKTYRQLIDPGMPILPEATKLHGISDADVADAPTFGEIAPGLFRFLGAADLAGFGIRRLAIPLLVAEFEREMYHFERVVRSVVDLEEIYLHHNPRHLEEAVGYYLGRELPPRSGAMSEAEACGQILDAQLGRHEELPRTVRGLAAYPSARDPMGLFRKESELRPLIFAEGPHRGRTPEEVAAVAPNYLRSLLGPGLLFYPRSIIERALAKVAGPTDPGTV